MKQLCRPPEVLIDEIFCEEVDEDPLEYPVDEALDDGHEEYSHRPQSLGDLLLVIGREVLGMHESQGIVEVT